MTSADRILQLPDEIIQYIFSLISENESIRDKMRLELVCKRFKLLVANKYSWRFNDELTIASDCEEKMILINEFPFSPSVVFRALESLLQKLKTVTCFSKFDHDGSDFCFEPATARLAPLVSKYHSKFQLSQLDLHHAKLFAPNLLSCDLSSVRSVRCSNSYELSNDSTADFEALLSVISACRNIDRLEIIGPENAVSDPDAFVEALKDKPLRALLLSDLGSAEECKRVLKIEDLAKICNSLPMLEELKLATIEEMDDIVMFNDLLTKETRERLKSISLDVNDDDRFEETKAWLFSLARQYPNVEQIWLRNPHSRDEQFCDNWECEIIGKTILNLLCDLGNCAVLRSVELKMRGPHETNASYCKDRLVQNLSKLGFIDSVTDESGLDHKVCALQKGNFMLRWYW